MEPKKPGTRRSWKELPNRGPQGSLSPYTAITITESCQDARSHTGQSQAHPFHVPSSAIHPSPASLSHTALIFPPTHTPPLCPIHSTLSLSHHLTLPHLPLSPTRTAPPHPHCPLHSAGTHTAPGHGPQLSHPHTPNSAFFHPSCTPSLSPTHTVPLRHAHSPPSTLHILPHAPSPLPHPPPFSTLPGRAPPRPRPGPGLLPGTCLRPALMAAAPPALPFPEAPGAGAGAAREERTHAGELGTGH